MDVTVERVVVCTGVGSAIDVGGEIRNGEWEMNTFSIGFIFFHICLCFLSSFSTRVVFKN